MTQLGFDGRPPQGLPFFKFPLTEFCSSVSIASVSLDRGRVQAAVSRIHCRETICWWLNFTCRDHGSVPATPFFPRTVHPFPHLPSDPPQLLMMCFCQQKSYKAFGSFPADNVSSYILWWFMQSVAGKGETKHVRNVCSTPYGTCRCCPVSVTV